MYLKKRKGDKEMKENKDAYRVIYTSKGTNEVKEMIVYAKNRLEASNYMILNGIYGKQHKIEYCSVNLMK